MSTQEPDARDCDTVADQVYEFLESEQTPAQAAEIREQLTECDPALAALTFEEMLAAVLKRCCAERAPEHLRARVLAFTRQSMGQGTVTTQSVVMVERFENGGSAAT